MRSATTAESSDSIAPSSATVSAGRKSVGIRSAWNSGSARCGSRTGCRRSGCRPSRRRRRRASPPPCRRPARESRPGTRGATRRSTIISASAARRRRALAATSVPAAGDNAAMRAANSDGTSRELQPEEVAQLRARDEHRDAVREPDDDRPRQVLDRACPCPSTPRTSRITPAIIVTMNRPSTP